MVILLLRTTKKYFFNETLFYKREPYNCGQTFQVPNNPSLNSDITVHDLPCICYAIFSTQLWSMKKQRWVNLPLLPKLPDDFSFFNGCSIAIDRQRVLLIGGHHNWPDDLWLYPVSVLLNNQVILYDFLTNSWTWMSPVPLPLYQVSLYHIWSASM